MTSQLKKRFHNPRLNSRGSAILILVVCLMSVTLGVQESLAVVTNFERVSVGTGGVEGNQDSFFVTLSEDASIVAFESFASNWAPDQFELNFVDIFVRNRTTNTTAKISGVGGTIADQRSFDPVVSADGRYVSFTSYATNLVPGDTNRNIFDDDGLDVFLYDRVTGSLNRVSLNWKGEQINANSVGRISPDAKLVLFATNGNGVAQNDFGSNEMSAIYVRDLQNGAIERITRGPSGEFPNGEVKGAISSYDGRYIVYLSDASNLVTDDNGVRDVMLYDRVTGQTSIVSKPLGGGQGNGMSGPARITPDGRYIVFRSDATNLVPGDSNSKSDIFVYDRTAGTLELVSLSSSGAQANADSRDPAICGSGRFVSFTSEATNLVPLPHNGHRQIFVHDRVTKTTFLATGTDTFMGNGRAHRSTLSADCSTIGFATEATNLVSGDLNGMRDLFVGDIIIAADLSPSYSSISGFLVPGAQVVYTFTIKNFGTETAVVEFNSPIPANTSYVTDSLTGAGANFNAGQNAVEWSGSLQGNGEFVISYAVTVEPALVDFTLIENDTTITLGTKTYPLENVFAVNGLKTFLPLVRR